MKRRILALKESRYRALIVDDDEGVRKLLVDVLTSRGHVCEVASHGTEALEKFGDNNFDAVITDIVMPNMDGIMLMKELLKINADLPVMVMTGFFREYSYDDCISAGAGDFIIKPFQPEELIARFDRMMRDHTIKIAIKEKRKELERIHEEMKQEFQWLSSEAERKRNEGRKF